MIRRHALALVLVLAALVGPAATAHAGGSIKLGKPAVDPAPQALITAEKPVHFSVAGLFKPTEEDEEPWIRFVWNFGDGTAPVQSAMLFGNGVQTHALDHTFAQGGLYNVTVTGGHGFDFFGFKFQKSKTFQVKVECPGMDPGPKKCAKGTFSPFKGTWAAIDSGFPDQLKNPKLTLEQAGKNVIGALTYKGGQSGQTQTVTVTGKMKYDAKNGVQVLLVKFKDAYQVGTAGFEAEGRLLMSASDDDALAYRAIRLDLHAGQDTFEDSHAIFVLQERADENTAQVCSTIGAGKKSVKPDGSLAFVVVVANEGLASLPADRARMDIVVEGGTLIEDPLILERARLRQAGFDPKNLKINLAALGAGKGLQNSLSELFFAVRPDPGSTQISVTTTLFDDPNAADPPFVLQAPPTRRLCIPVVE